MQDPFFIIYPNLQLQEATPEMLENVAKLRQPHDKEVSFQEANLLHWQILEDEVKLRSARGSRMQLTHFFCFLKKPDLQTQTFSAH